MRVRTSGIEEQVVPSFFIKISQPVLLVVVQTSGIPTLVPRRFGSDKFGCLHTYGLNILLMIKYLIFEEIYVERERKHENMIKEFKQLRRPANRGCLLTFSWRLV